LRSLSTAIAELGETDDGLSRIRSALVTQLSIGAQVARSYSLAVLANTLWHAGRTEEGLQAVEDGLAVSKRNGEPFYDAELWRLKGDLSKMQDKTVASEFPLHRELEQQR
jgi:hypothetical protein